jgi:cytoplasmic iron level regulating protein YaaA (DUF328/UPF0246 family)
MVLISPAKSLDFEKNDYNSFSQARLLKDTEQLIKILKKKSSKSLQKLMHISPKLGDLNAIRYHQFEMDHNWENSKQSVLAFKGDVYIGLEAETLKPKDLEYAQTHLRILSGLYGLLKPLDLIQPYRLEMGSKLRNGRGKNLYNFWGNRITKLVNEDLKESGDDVIINLASKEYFQSVKRKDLNATIYDVHFREFREGEFKFLSYDAKKARGFLSRYIIQNNLSKPEDIKGFDTERYLFNEELSSEYEYFFTR